MDRKIKNCWCNELVSELKFRASYWKGFHLIERSYMPLNTVFYIEVHAVPNFASLLL